MVRTIADGEAKDNLYLQSNFNILRALTAQLHLMNGNATAKQTI
jgi:hypothetical protein